MNTDEMIEVMQAYVRGEAIEFCDLDRPDIWLDIGGRVRLNEACKVIGNIFENKI
jgi:hypothetical protein|nr:MAG TPA: YopX protein [Caudoviricetes sp.]